MTRRDSAPADALPLPHPLVVAVAAPLLQPLRPRLLRWLLANSLEIQFQSLLRMIPESDVATLRPSVSSRLET